MSYFIGETRVGYDNIAAGSVTGRENIQAGSAVDSQALPPANTNFIEAPSDTVSTTLARTGDTVTATATAHGLAVSQMVVIAGADQLPYNGVFQVLTAADADTFTYEVFGSPTSPATGTITCRPLTRVSKRTATSTVFHGVEILSD